MGTHIEMGLAGDNRHIGLDIPPHRGAFHQRQQHQDHQKVGNDICRYLGLVALGHVGRVQAEEGGVGQQHVQPVQVLICAAAEGTHAVEGAEVERPYLDDGSRGGG